MTEASGVLGICQEKLRLLQQAAAIRLAMLGAEGRHFADLRRGGHRDCRDNERHCALTGGLHHAYIVKVEYTLGPGFHIHDETKGPALEAAVFD